MALVGEYQMLNMWKEFFENLTVEWLVENCLEEEKRTRTDQNRFPIDIDTFDLSFSIYYYGRTTFRFKTPTWLEELRSSSDDRLFEHFPMEVWEDFIRMLEL